MELHRNQAKTQEHEEPTPEKRPYRKPILAEYGDIRDMTLGSTSGNLESGGGPITFRF